MICICIIFVYLSLNYVYDLVSCFIALVQFYYERYIFVCILDRGNTDINNYKYFVFFLH